MELLFAWSVGVLVASACGFVVFLEMKRRGKLPRRSPPAMRAPMQQPPLQQQQSTSEPESKEGQP